MSFIFLRYFSHSKRECSGLHGRWEGGKAPKRLSRYHLYRIHISLNSYQVVFLASLKTRRSTEQATAHNNTYQHTSPKRSNTSKQIVLHASHRFADVFFLCKTTVECIISWLSVLYAQNGRKVTVWILYRYEMAPVFVIGTPKFQDWVAISIKS